jgi:hypothetical protein
MKANLKTGMKICCKCRRELPIGEYYKDKSLCDGLRRDCKSCSLEMSRKYYQKNREKIAEKHGKYRQKNREKIAEKGRKYYQKNKEKVAERHRKYQQRNKDLYRKYKAKRERNLGFKKIPQYKYAAKVFEHSNTKYDWHHTTDENVLPLPRSLHKKCYAGSNKKLHRLKALQAIKILYMPPKEKP